jgi:hypothetical protein
MGREIIKCDKEVDFYMEWSSVVDGPVCIGTREQVLAHLTTYATKGQPRYEQDLAAQLSRLKQADEVGSSGWTDWNSAGLILQRYGDMDLRFAPFCWIERSSFLPVARLLAATTHDEDWQRTLGFFCPPCEGWHKSALTDERQA